MIKQLEVEEIRKAQKEVAKGIGAMTVIEWYESGAITDIKLLTYKTAYAWCIMEHTRIEFNSFFEEQYDILLKYVIKHKKLNDLDNKLL